MVDFDKDRDANLAAFELTGGAAANGLTVRDYFAAKILVAIADNYEPETEPEFWGGVAEVAYAAADAMMAERERRPTEQCSVEEAFGLDK